MEIVLAEPIEDVLAAAIPQLAERLTTVRWREDHFACMTCTPSQSGCGNAAMNALQRWIYS